MTQSRSRRRIPTCEYRTDAQLRRQVALCHVLNAAGVLVGVHAHSFCGRIADYLLGEESLNAVTPAWSKLYHRLVDLYPEED